MKNKRLDEAREGEGLCDSVSLENVDRTLEQTITNWKTIKCAESENAPDKLLAFKGKKGWWRSEQIEQTKMDSKECNQHAT